MRAPVVTFLLAAVVLVDAGCASVMPREQPQAKATDPACESATSDPLHMTSSSAEPKRDFEIESILMQQPSDSRLAGINRSMYQSLHSLDVELRREQRIAACKQLSSDAPTLEARANDQTGAQAGAVTGAASLGVGGVGSGGAGTSAGSVSTTGASTGGVNASISNGLSNGASTAVAATNVHRTGLISPQGGGGNGLTAPKIVPGSDNDIVARRLRKAAEEEKDPALRAKLWKEYNDYQRGASAK